MVGVHDEGAFEAAIEASLLDPADGGYQQGSAYTYDPTLGIDTAEVFAFLGATQPEAWERLLALRGNDADLAQQQFAKRLDKEIDARGTVDVLRHGVEDLGVLLRLAYFRAASGLNPELEARYAANRLTVVRQLHYAAKHPDRSLDLVLFVNGLPVATAELKNPLTGQDVNHAMAQYRTDRDPADVLLGRRAVVHFAVDPDTVMMTTRLAGKETRFLPFNQGSGGPGQSGGAGNPAGGGDETQDPGHRTAYLWREVWQRDTWLDILGRFVHVDQGAPGKKAKATKQPGSVIFPRFHQWHAVRAMEADARQRGPGQQYLVQHSAGSGKSNTIAWLAHRLASLHDDNDDKVFDKVIVITDRLVLDRQLQDTIHQFEHTPGVVARIDQDSQQLAAALTGGEAKIIVTTLWKFPFVVEKIAGLTRRSYAVLIDEAHSSQSGEASKEMKAVLGTGADGGNVADLDGENVEVVDGQDVLNGAIEASAAARGQQSNLSLFAFTATPKAKTLELFGDPFHLYSMRQAIEEGFILEVLAGYTTYNTFFRLQNSETDDPEVESRKAAAKIAAFVSLHPENMAQRARIVVDHFREHTSHQIGGRAKAMVVCRSRLHAVRMRQAIDACIAADGIGGLSALVAYSGMVHDAETATEWTESKMNGFPESQTAERFASPDHQLLVVAEKFQTGFDQPLLHTMYVDKKLVGVNAVQTLSRLNRTHPDKTSTFVLDFANDADSVRASFEPYYEATSATPTDPNLVFDARNTLDAFGILRDQEIDAFAALWFGGNPKDRTLHAKLYEQLDPARDRFVSDLDEDDQDQCRQALDRFVNLYAFLAQVLPLASTELEKKYLYCRFLRLRLPKQKAVALDLDLDLTHLRISENETGPIALQGDAKPLVAFAGDGTGSQYLPGFEPLSDVITRFNETFGLDLDDADQLHIQSIVAEMAADPRLQQQASANTRENFGIPFDDSFHDKVVDRLKKNEDFTYRLLDDPSLDRDVRAWVLPEVYEKARVAFQKSCPVVDLLDRGEDQHLELKSTLRWDVREQTKSKVVEHAVLKTVAAFLNSRFGGTLLIGVREGPDGTGQVIGLADDYATLHKADKDDADLFQLHLTQIVANAVGLAAAANVTTRIDTVDGQQLCRVHVEPSGHPVRVNDVFYIRLNNGTRAIEDELEVERYIAQRWGR